LGGGTGNEDRGGGRTAWKVPDSYRGKVRNFLMTLREILYRREKKGKERQ